MSLPAAAAVPHTGEGRWRWGSDGTCHPCGGRLGKVSLPELELSQSDRDWHLLLPDFRNTLTYLEVSISEVDKPWKGLFLATPASVIFHFDKELVSSWAQAAAQHRSPGTCPGCPQLDLSVPTEQERWLLWGDTCVLSEIPLISSIWPRPPPPCLGPGSDQRVISETSFLKTKRKIDRIFWGFTFLSVSESAERGRQVSGRQAQRKPFTHTGWA